MKKFLIYQRLDSADKFIETLEQAGYIRVKYGNEADFFLYDSESVGKRWDIKVELLKRIPGFIYPHNAFAYPIWDGLYAPLPVQCNFVFGPSAMEAMRIYGYPYRVEMIGFPYFKIRPFAPSKHTRLLFVPTRWYPGYELYRKVNQYALDFVLKYRDYFEKIIIVRSSGAFEDLVSNGNLEVIVSDPKKNNQPLLNMINRIEQVDIVLSNVSTAVIAMAMGKGVVMYGRHALEGNGRGIPKHIAQYMHLRFCPLQLEDLSIDMVLQSANYRSDEMQNWIDNQLGGNFNAYKFISVIGEYV